jgi:hypothetical protein
MRSFLFSLLLVFLLGLSACESDSSASDGDNTSDAGATDGGITELDAAGISDTADVEDDADIEDDACWWCTDADAASAPDTLEGTGADSGKGGGGLKLEECIDECTKKGDSQESCEEICSELVDDGKGDIGDLTLEECIEGCVEKGESQETCEEICPELVGGGDKGEEEDCYEDCIAKGTSEAECLELCGDDGKGEGGEGGDSFMAMVMGNVDLDTLEGSLLITLTSTGPEAEVLCQLSQPFAEVVADDSCTECDFAMMLTPGDATVLTGTDECLDYAGKEGLMGHGAGEQLYVSFDGVWIAFGDSQVEGSLWTFSYSYELGGDKGDDGDK